MFVRHSGRCAALGRFARKLVCAIAAIAVCAAPGGCVQRRLTVRTNPPGALVYVDEYPIGTTPCSTSFTYYGKRKIRLVKDGFETLTLMQNIPVPWYEIPPLDFVSENVVPGEIRDQRILDYQLTPQLVFPPEQLLSRAEGLRRGVHAASGTTPSVPPAAVRIGPGGAPAAGAAAPGPPELIPTPPGVGGQPVYPLPPR